MSTHYEANQARLPKFRVIDPSYTMCGQVGVQGNKFGTHTTLHFPNGDCFNFDNDKIEELTWHDASHDHPENYSTIDILDSGLIYFSGLRVHNQVLYKDGSTQGTLAICRKWRYSA